MNQEKLVCVKDLQGNVYRCSCAAAKDKARKYGWTIGMFKEEWKATGRKMLGGK